MRRTLCSAAICLLIVGCGDDPFLVRWRENPQEAVLFSLDREELNRPSAFAMLGRTRVVIEDPSSEGRWDFAVERQGERMMLLPPGALGVTSSAAIVPFPATVYDEITRAPSDTLLYVDDEPVPIDVGTIYVVRTHQQATAFGSVCVYYGKIEPLEIDVLVGTFRFLHDTSPACNNRSLVPPR